MIWVDCHAIAAKNARVVTPCVQEGCHGGGTSSLCSIIVLQSVLLSCALLFYDERVHGSHLKMSQYRAALIV